MEFLSKELIIALAAATTAYAAVRIYMFHRKNSKRLSYKDTVEVILNSDDYKVKGKFED